MPPPKPLSDRWLARIKDNPLIAAVIVLGTISGAVIAFWDKAENFYQGHIETPVSLAAFHLAPTSDAYFEEKMMTCKFDGRNVRTFLPPPGPKTNRVISLDFVFSNKSKSDAVFTGVDLVVAAAEQVAGGVPGIVVPNHRYVLNIKHEVGTQSFQLIPVYKIPANDTGSFTLVFKPASEGVGLCWIMHALFKTSLGNVKSEDFSLVMSNFK